MTEFVQYPLKRLVTTLIIAFTTPVLEKLKDNSSRPLTLNMIKFYLDIRTKTVFYFKATNVVDFKLNLILPESRAVLRLYIS